MWNIRSQLAAAALAATVWSAGGGPALAAGAPAPVDRVSNPGALDFPDVGTAPADMDEPFVRDGVVSEPARFAAIRPGMEQAQVLSALGEPLGPQASRGSMWDYNFKFRLPQSQNYLVCQYKVVFDAQARVLEGVWRRRQCEQLVQTAMAQ